MCVSDRISVKPPLERRAFLPFKKHFYVLPFYELPMGER